MAHRPASTASYGFLCVGAAVIAPPAWEAAGKTTKRANEPNPAHITRLAALDKALERAGRLHSFADIPSWSTVVKASGDGRRRPASTRPGK